MNSTTSSAWSSATMDKYLDLQLLRDSFSGYARYNNSRQYPSLERYFRRIRSLRKGFNISVTKLKKHKTVITNLSRTFPCPKIRRQVVSANGHVDFLRQKLNGIYEKISETQEAIKTIVARDFSTPTPLPLDQHLSTSSAPTSTNNVSRFIDSLSPASSSTTTSTSTTNMSSIPTDQVFFELGFPIVDFSDFENDLLWWFGTNHFKRGRVVGIKWPCKKQETTNDSINTNIKNANGWVIVRKLNFFFNSWYFIGWFNHVHKLYISTHFVNRRRVGIY